MKKPNPYMWVSLLTVILIVAALFLFTPQFELVKPVIKPVTSLEMIGQKKIVSINASDDKSGIRHIDISIVQEDKRHTLASLDFLEKRVLEKPVTVEINPLHLKFRDGEATLIVTAKDYSLFGNTTRLVRKVMIDMTPPAISLVSSYHYINPGGSCLALYKVSKEVEKSGVMTESDFSLGYPVSLNGRTVYMAYFAVPMNIQKGSVQFSVYALDKSGNEASLSIPCYVKPKNFRKDVVELPDAFMSRKMPEFQQRDMSLQGKSPIESFTYINQMWRSENDKTIRSICGKSAGSQLWEGPFLRMKNSAPMAMFGDVRTYTYNKQKVGDSVHLGVDLASTAHVPIEAANNGTVVFTGYLGIYGNTVIIDHGLGVFSLYAHMSEVKTKAGQQVAKAAVIGSSGQTGLAGGDHLHFSIIVGGAFVNPVEWWDPHWIRDNVDKKIAEASQLR